MKNSDLVSKKCCNETISDAEQYVKSTVTADACIMVLSLEEVLKTSTSRSQE